MDRQSENRALISDLTDGELDEARLDEVISLLAEDDEACLAWEAYHLTRDVLRHGAVTSDVALGRSGASIVGELRKRLQQETIEPLTVDTARVPPLHAVRVAVLAERPEAANAPVFRWRLVAGVSSMAAVAAVGWALVVSQPASERSGALLAQSQVPAQAVAVVQPAQADAQAVMLRDPQLDELLAAHKQFAGSSALQSPAGFLRNATFEGPVR